MSQPISCVSKLTTYEALKNRTALLTKRSAVRSTNTWLPSVHDGAVKCGLGVKGQFPRLTQAHRAVPS